MFWDEYVKWTDKTAIYPDAGLGTERARQYVTLGLLSELGEVAGVLKRRLRDGTPEEEFRQQLKAELGDVAWYLARARREGLQDAEPSLLQQCVLSAALEPGSLDEFQFLVAGNDVDFREVLTLNVSKLESRQRRGTLKGAGDDR